MLGLQNILYTQEYWSPMYLASKCQTRTIYVNSLLVSYYEPGFILYIYSYNIIVTCTYM